MAFPFLGRIVALDRQGPVAGLFGLAASEEARGPRLGPDPLEFGQMHAIEIRGLFERDLRQHFIDVHEGPLLNGHGIGKKGADRREGNGCKQGNPRGDGIYPFWPVRCMLSFRISDRSILVRAHPARSRRFPRCRPWSAHRRQLLKLSATFPSPFHSERRLQDRLHLLTQAGFLRRGAYATIEPSILYYYTLSPESSRLLYGEDLPRPSCRRASAYRASTTHAAWANFAYTRNSPPLSVVSPSPISTRRTPSPGGRWQ